MSTKTSDEAEALSEKQAEVLRQRRARQLLDARGRKEACDSESAEADAWYRACILTGYEAGLTYDELAEYAGCSRWWIAKLLRAERDAVAAKQK